MACGLAFGEFLAAGVHGQVDLFACGSPVEFEGAVLFGVEALSDAEVGFMVVVGELPAVYGFANLVELIIGGHGVFPALIGLFPFPVVDDIHP